MKIIKLLLKFLICLNLILNINNQIICYDISILFHCYDLNLLDEFIGKINYFIDNNKNHSHNLIVNIPIDTNIKEDRKIISNKKKQVILKNCPYHKYLITNNNVNALYTIYKHIQNKINLHKNKIVIIFSENRGVDIGGFFLQLDYINKNNIKHDYIVKIHTKSQNDWREKITQILSLSIDQFFPKYKSIYTNRYVCPSDHPYNNINLNRIKEALDLRLPFDINTTFGHSSGTMFIASKEFSDFWKNYNMINLFNKLSIRRDNYEHNIFFECYFGYIIDMIIGQQYLCVI